MAAKNKQGEEDVERVSFAYRDLSDINARIVAKYAPSVKELDLSNNNISDLTPLKSFVKLHTLVLDGNRVHSHTRIPVLPKLHTLWVNSNAISNLTVFIDKLVESTPALKFLSMLKNEACPNFFNGHSLKDYNDYRRYVISKLPGLSVLDSTPITESERAEGARLYSNIVTPTIVTPPIIASKPEPEASVASSSTENKKKKKKKSKSKSKSRGNNENGHSILPDVPAGEVSGEAPPPLGGHAGDDDFDDSSDSSGWTDEEDR